MSRRRAVLIAASLALGGCGFHLVGSATLPPSLKKPYVSVKDPYTDFAREFERGLTGAGAVVQTAREGASATIEVSRDQVQVRTLSVSARNIPTEYELTYTVTLAVQGALDKQLLAPQTLTLTRDYSFNENEQLAKEHEADVLRRQMARDLAGIAVRRLASLKAP